ncbi:phosphate-selective porin OprO/OprP [Altererythrobacter atlanticus]|uniref:Phosphate-selective porin O and P n=1 Tax=Croceibacterium atlanticum TaxID=1267766 RepID=A0A0F7KQS5_9SPHN|nr:porin [Croceibacterium atlanticum]AKH41446.1 Phosphate-selective porin O and P [Croceibacterium atlanticum]MBB5732908.1 phosphate-selective porin OprO/OprP [Croceibacterium atlanticum]
MIHRLTLASMLALPVALLPSAAHGQADTSSSDAAKSAPIPMLDEGAPRIGDKKGWSIKPRGRIQVDLGKIDAPESLDLAEDYNSEFRRARLGVDATAPGGFAFRFEMDFSEHEDQIMDAYASYKNGPLLITAGQHNTVQTLEELTSSLSISFAERSAFTDAFQFQRRIGVSGQYVAQDILVQAGIFTDNIEDLGDRNRSADVRIAAMPRLGDVQLHFGGSVHYAWYEDGTDLRYSARPQVHSARNKLVDTARFSAESELGTGLEFAAIRGPVHVTGEVYRQHVDRGPGMADPTFYGAYAEIGLFLTPGDSRPYSKGSFDRIRPVRPVTQGGPGAWQVNLRYDHLDLSDGDISGGRQSSYRASLIWTPSAQTRLMVDYGRQKYSGAILAEPDGNRAYNVDSLVMRAQLDF